MILLLWEKDAASPLHILHGGFGIGSFIIPLIANPFLAVPKPSSILDTSNLTNNVSSQLALSELSISSTVSIPLNASTGNVSDVIVTEYLRESRIEFAYLIAALLTLALSVVFYVYHFRGFRFQKIKSLNPDGSSRKAQMLTKCKAMVNPATCANGNFLYGVQLFTVLFIYYFNIVGGERILGKFIRAYSIEQLGFSVDEGSYINTAFWISFAIGRISGFVAARYIPIRKLIIIETSGVFIFSVLLNIFAVNNSLALWILIQPLGLFHAPCFPSGMGWADFHVEMTGIAITFLLLGASIGGVVYLKLTGFLFEKYGARAFLFHILGYGIACIALAILLDVLGAQYGSRFKDDDEDEEKDLEMTKFNDEGYDETLDTSAYVDSK